MKRAAEASPLTLPSAEPAEPEIATIESIEDGICWVAQPGSEKATKALILRHVAAQATIGATVLVVRVTGSEPIIAGIIDDRIAQSELDRDGHLRISAKKSVSLECGEAALTLRGDGSVTIRGDRVASRARQSNTLRGATVKIN